MKKIISILLITLFLPFASAYLSSDIYLNNDGSATFVGQASLPLGIEGIEFQKGKIFGETQELTSKQGSLWLFSLSLNDTAELRIFLPENSELKSEIESNLESGIGIEKGTIVISLAGTNPSIRFSYEVKRNGRNDYSAFLIVLGLSLLLLLLIFILFKIKKKPKKEIKQDKKQKKMRKIDIVKKTLNERETVIVNGLIKTGRVKQSFLQRKTGIPKASFSRHIQNLEKKGIIIKTGLGRNNFVELRKEMLNST